MCKPKHKHLSSSGFHCLLNLPKTTQLIFANLHYLRIKNMQFSVSNVPKSCFFLKKKNPSWPLFMDQVQLPQGYRATTRRQFTFYHLVPRNYWYSFDWPRKNKWLSNPWSHPVVLDSRSQDWESRILTTRPLFYIWRLQY